ncbi:F420-0--gamma-glutamyl ligase [candidate division WWE3 bacterium CG_4_9_14_0_2_um_filter_48_10]|uniref:F420-0--gamma-glutamyl ligase n=1 Tax=candidate division WWE3 bacterium CG_4_9_14_0_2_um_filter_48_10 TaxID=1975078 RepID=A0A2M8EJG1_UNCKA|nr:MAG: F420-0--gamma-glutamyl ligase [candidate division WWE3 bacterium CG_4_9_14_0_2_um_filter_48_10]
MVKNPLKPNPERKLYIKVAGKRFARLPIKTHVIVANDDIVKMVEKYAKPHLQPGDILVVGERIVAITQGRSFPIEMVEPSLLARLLSKFVYKPPYGIGIGSPYTMELALRDANPFRFALALLLSAITKPFGIRGVFYHVVGGNINAIDGPCNYTLPPYNRHAKLGPKNPGRVVAQLEKVLGFPVVIADTNDKAARVLAASKEVDRKLVEVVLAGNPMGQSREQTPLCILRES